MPLSNLNIKPEYRTGECPPIQFYTDCLRNCIRFDRSAGFFTSTGLAEAAKGFAYFIHANGKIRLICSPLLEKSDYRVIVKKQYDKNLISDILINSIEETEDIIITDRLNVLAWLLSESKLEIKIAIRSESKGGMYHEKLGIFYDENGDSVAFSGSSNETKSGWVTNYESIDTFTSWGTYSERVELKINHFNKLWNNKKDGIVVFDADEAIKNRLLKFRTNPCPTDDHEYLISKKQKTTIEPSIPNSISLRDYQLDAINKWKENKWCGIFEMATGAGKTFTAIAGIIELRKVVKRLFTIILVPNTHLINQWSNELSSFNIEHILAYQSRAKWGEKVKRALARYRRGSITEICIISTIPTFLIGKNPLSNIIKDIDPSCILLIIDEVHNIGSQQYRKKLPDCYKHRLGLTATIQRYFDESGTEFIKNYFSGVVSTVTLEDSIKKGFLCEYNYYPHIVTLTQSESIEYFSLTKRIQKLVVIKESGGTIDEDALQRLYEKRVAILNNAEEKYKALIPTILSIKATNKYIIYCSDQQIDYVCKILNQSGIVAKRVTYLDSPDDRSVIFNEFKNGLIDCMVAMQVLDEGLDLPSVETALFLSNTGNPKQFIQRRGRILRKSKEKQFANVIDFIAIPQLVDGVDEKLIKTALSREFKRFAMFADLASNRVKALEVIWTIAKNNNMLDIL